MHYGIRGWRLADAEDLATSINNKNVQDNLRDGLPFPYAVQDGAEYINSMLEAPKDSTYAWAITADDHAIGSLGIFRKENIHRFTAEMGYFIAEPYWGRGIVTVAIKEACAHIFAHTDILRIFAEPFIHNKGSRRALEKAGFQLEGILRRNAVKNGEVIDMCMYALVKD